jgi:hypothetical protein
MKSHRVSSHSDGHVESIPEQKAQDSRLEIDLCLGLK